MDEKQITQEIQTYDVASVVISNQDEYQSAGEIIIGLDGLKKKIVEYWKEPKRKAHEAHKEITRKENEMLAPVNERRSTLNRKISGYLTALESERRKKEAEERKRIEARAKRAEEKGKEEKAEQLREVAESVYVQPKVEKTTRTDVGSVTQKKEIDIYITDVKELLRQVIAGKIPESVISVNEFKVKQFIKNFELKEFPGVRITESVKASFRSK